jgi:hypothetical protein
VATEQQIKQVKSRHSARLLQQPGVCGVGVEKDEHGGFALTVHLDATQPDAGATVPDSIEGCPVRRVRSGPFTKS